MGQRSRRSINKALRENRENKGISVAKLAQRSGIEEAVIVDIEVGGHDPSQRERVALSVALKAPLPGVSGEVLDDARGLIDLGRDNLKEFKV